jgi:hypothetical protein
MYAVGLSLTVQSRVFAEAGVEESSIRPEGVAVFEEVDVLKTCLNILKRTDCGIDR